MTKSQFRVLKEAREIISNLYHTDRINESLNKTYRGTIASCDDELGMLVLTVENNPEVFEHPYWNDELAGLISSGSINSSIELEANISKSENGDYTLDVYNNEIAQCNWHFENYITEEDAKEDIAVLEAAGVKVKLIA